ncbi:PREDICTED: mannosyl-oligosaccharide 1,2-alpha-mannosidase IA-like [Amphimedon queenslandica]|uniref:alpha-1,2-Mannosidase n=1 Tax=Amphimedon queenslandica TaxID=400682 RepID=A0A1X7VIX6_AMPQE|nr:PREDICTED: mannosyl-oligosaccharide 1,2-alpha-mannosidase IA-like [Amphimedon queenslandica]|eukprot:XP_011410113.1 PREDICTED: mannosyl-oligosaccharide 1,2-alpha-mannosidase IA-like [Amphimedon queenslandica]
MKKKRAFLLSLFLFFLLAAVYYIVTLQASDDTEFDSRSLPASSVVPNTASTTAEEYRRVANGTEGPTLEISTRSLETRETEDKLTIERQQQVKNMIKHAWDGYEKYAMGQNELKPISRTHNSRSMFSSSPIGATLVDSLDTLYVAGLMDEYNRAKKWVKDHFDISQVSSGLSFFEVNIRFIGGFISAYQLTGEEVFKDKAIEVAKRFNPAFNTQSGLPKPIVKMKTGETEFWGWIPGQCSLLSELGTLHLEYQSLSYLSNDKSYLEKVLRIRNKLRAVRSSEGFYYTMFSIQSGHWCNRHVSLGAYSDSFYEYLLKVWLLTNKEDTESKDMFYEAIDALDTRMFEFVSEKKLFVISDLRNGQRDGKMQHLACFAGGMFALASVHATNGKSQHYMDIAKNITRTCHESYVSSVTKLGPDIFGIGSSGKVNNVNPKYILRPETVESYFYLWRLTRDPMYREWGWELVQALEKYCKVSTGGYTGLRNVNSPDSRDDEQQTFFLSETLKYLYLLFSDDKVVSLDEWVFNTEGHPLRIINQK